MPVLLLTRHIPLIPGAATVGGGVASGAEIAGSIGGVVGALIAVAALFVTIAGNNAKRRREYDQEIRAAEERGEQRAEDRLQPALDRTQRDMEFWRGIAYGGQSVGGDPMPTPPSEQHPLRARPRDDQSED